MFQFPPFTTLPYLFRQGWHALRMPGFPIRTSPDQCLLAAPRGFSQLATSFLISWRQGIRHVPLLPRPLLLKSASQVSSRSKLVLTDPPGQTVGLLGGKAKLVFAWDVVVPFPARDKRRIPGWGSVRPRQRPCCQGRLFPP